MKTKTALILILILALKTQAQSSSEVLDLASANGFKPSQRIVKAIVNASHQYKVSASELTAIAILETSLGQNSKPRINSNGTIDKGLFQINTVNHPKCIEFNLDTPEASALCAAKLLSKIRSTRADYLGAYHSKTPKFKNAYIKRITRVLAKAK